MIQWHIGCSGFYYKHWKEIFYPKGVPQRLWFEYYSRHFSTLELNVTFYRFPELAVFKSWYLRSAGDFTFSVKAPRLITHYKKMNDCEQLLNDFYGRVAEGLKEKTGCVLFQFPPGFDYTPERLDKIINHLNPKFPNVVEFRNSSWWNEEVYKILGEKNITFSGMSHPKLPETIVENTPMLYYRMHGVPDLYSSSYSTANLKKMIKSIKSSRKIKSAFIYFNNDIGGNAIKNAQEMKAMV
ncbi:MAG: DUF72 domain-containing protein [Ginsengibacter sp.]